MKRLNGREMKALLVLSIIVPISLLTTLRFTGVLREPALQTLNMTPITWQIDRPRQIININDLVQKAFTNGEASIDADLHVVGYYEDWVDELYQGRDGLEIWVSVRANMKYDFRTSLSVRFCPDDDSFVGVPEDGQTKRNITVTAMKARGTNASEAYILATPTDSSMYLDASAHWIFNDENTEDHQLKLTLEFTYQNASTYKKVVFPVLVTMFKDVGGTFEDSKLIQAGEYRGSLDSVDFADMYRIAVQEGQTVNITLTPPGDADYDLYLYNQNQETVANSTSRGNAVETITYRAKATQMYYVKVTRVDWPMHSSKGPYTLRVKIGV